MERIFRLGIFDPELGGAPIRMIATKRLFMLSLSQIKIA
jgi:hypothetical protein